MGGNAIEAAIATMICDGASTPEYMGLGGGFLMTYYDAATKKVTSINARETAPGAAEENMFSKDPKSSVVGKCLTVQSKYPVKGETFSTEKNSNLRETGRFDGNRGFRAKKFHRFSHRPTVVVYFEVIESTGKFSHTSDSSLPTKNIFYMTFVVCGEIYVSNTWLRWKDRAHLYYIKPHGILERTG